jgi:hypothetical protein
MTEFVYAFIIKICITAAKFNVRIITFIWLAHFLFVMACPTFV